MAGAVAADEQEQDEIVPPEGWFIASQDPCDCFISFQNTRRPTMNFTYAYFFETETNTIDNIAKLLIKNLNCINPQIKKNEIGTHIISCENNINIDIWEVSNENPAVNLYATMISSNLNEDELNSELPRMLQASLQYQNISLDFHRSNRCSSLFNQRMMKKQNKNKKEGSEGADDPQTVKQ